MRIVKSLLNILAIIFVSNLNGQIVVKGFVVEKNSGEPIASASIYEPNSNNYAFTNNYGFYTLHLPKGKHTIVASAVGFFTDTVEIILVNDTTLNFRLLSITELEQITVVGRFSAVKSDMIGVEKIPINKIEVLPALGGETDITKAFQLLPGIVSGNEGSSNLVVRGSSPDQTLVILDDVPLYYVNHLGGFISTFNSDAIGDVTLYKGNFPARFGGRLSSVFDVTMKNGNLYRSSGAITTGLLISKFSLGIPIVRRKSSVLVSVRTAPIGLLLMPITYFGWGKQTYLYYGFYDLNLKFNYKINPRNRLYFSLYKGDDPLIFGLPQAESDFKLTFSQKWGNTLSAFRWNHIFGKSLFSNLTVYHTIFRYQFGYEFYSFDKKDSLNYQTYSAIKDFALKYDFTWSLSENFIIRFGLKSVRHDFSPVISHYSISIPTENYKLDTILFDNTFEAYEPIFYIENQIKTNKFSFNLGLRTTSFIIPEKKAFLYPEPRITAKFSPEKNWAIKISYTRTTQFTHLLTGIGSNGLPMDLWLPATSQLPPEQANQWATGIYTQQKDVEISLEAYYKTMSNLIAFAEGTNLLTSIISWQNNVEGNGKGWAYGVEFLVKKTQGKTTGWLSLTYSRSFRQFTNINLGNPYPYKYDRPLDISIVLIHKVKPNITLSADWVYGTGYPYTKPFGIVPLMDNTYQNSFYNQMLWQPRNSSRMQDYHRLDLALQLVKKRKRTTRIWSFSIYNAYNRLNSYYYSIRPECDFSTKICKWTIQKFTLFPIIPSVSYSLKW